MINAVKKNYIIMSVLFLILGACQKNQLNEINKTIKEIENVIEGKETIYFAYQENRRDVFLKSEQIAYNNRESKFYLKNSVAQISSGQDLIFLLAEEGFYFPSTKNFQFFQNVKIVVEKKYLLEGAFFHWISQDKILKSEANTVVSIRDNEGSRIEGINFLSRIEEKKIFLEQVNITIPESVAKNEGLD